MKNFDAGSSPELEEEINLILDSLEDAVEAGTPLSVESACVEFPELIPVVLERWNRLNRVNLITSLPAASLPPDHTLGGGIQKSKFSNDSTGALWDFQSGVVFEAKTELALEDFHANGGLGEVYKARERHNTRRVALKILRNDRESQGNRLHFDRECKILARLNHPGIISIYGSGNAPDGRPFYTMPFLREGNFDERIDGFHANFPSCIDAGSLEFRELLSNLINVCKAVAYAHSRGIAHRDLKPQNVMLGRYGEVWVIDWGAAWRFDRDFRFKSTGEESVFIDSFQKDEEPRLITPRFASPEQHDCSSIVGPESDIYSLGAILYKVLCGRPPFSNVDDFQLHSAVRKLEPQRPSSLKQGIPRSLQAICLKAMQKKSADRYDTLVDLAKDLERYLADEPVSVIIDSVPLRTYRFLRRHSRGTLFAFVSAAIFAGFVTTLLIKQSFLTQRTKEVAMQRLGLAAALASSVSGVELDRRWRVLEAEAATSELADALAAIHAGDSSESHIKILQGLLDRRSNQLQRIDGIKHESLFIMDESGTQLARSPYSTESIGANYAYRDYFHGRGKEFPRGSSPPPSSKPVLSIAYEGTDDGKMKVALSVPILSPNSLLTLPATKQTIGRLCMSMAIYDLQIFEQIEHLPIHFMLVETRDYTWQDSSATGLILDTNIPFLAPNLFPITKPPIAQSSRNAKGWKNEWLRKAVVDNGRNKKLDLSITHDECARVPIKVPGRGFSEDAIGWVILLSEDSQKK